MVKGMDGFPRWRLPLLVADVPKCSSGQEESSKTDGNPMIGAVCSPVLRAQGDRARPVQWSRGIFIPLGPVGFIPLGALLCGFLSIAVSSTESCALRA